MSCKACEICIGCEPLTGDEYVTPGNIMDKPLLYGYPIDGTKPTPVPPNPPKPSGGGDKPSDLCNVERELVFYI